jgi:hypothetical protein
VQSRGDRFLKKLVPVFGLALLAVMVSGCAPAIAPALPTFTPMPSSLPTTSFDVKRVPVREFIPNLLFEIPISFEVPQDYVLFEFPDIYHDTYFWMPQQYEGVFRPKDTSYFQAKLAPNVTYDSQSDKFINVPNDVNDEDIIWLLESDGAKLNRIERKKIGEFPILILELELSDEERPEVAKTRLVNRIYVATLVDTNVLWIDYYFSLPANQQKELAIWERFESSFERNP